MFYQTNLPRQFSNNSLKKLVLVTVTVLSMSACMSTAPTMGSSSGNTITGGAAGANAAGNP